MTQLASQAVYTSYILCNILAQGKELTLGWTLALLHPRSQRCHGRASLGRSPRCAHPACASGASSCSISASPKQVSGQHLTAFGIAKIETQAYTSCCFMARLCVVMLCNLYNFMYIHRWLSSDALLAMHIQHGHIDCPEKHDRYDANVQHQGSNTT